MVPMPVGTVLLFLNSNLFTSNLCKMYLSFIKSIFLYLGAAILNHQRLSVWILEVVLVDLGLAVRILLVE